jgi:uncharacterized protein DUF2809
MIFKFSKHYFSISLLLLALELYIGIYIHDAFVRPYGGDFLVVILLYCLVKSFINIPFFTTAICVLIFAYVVEVSQYFHLIQMLGLQHYKLAKLLLGTTFSFTDMFIYTLGILLVIVVENLRLVLKNF